MKGGRLGDDGLSPREKEDLKGFPDRKRPRGGGIEKKRGGNTKDIHRRKESREAEWSCWTS